MMIQPRHLGSTVILNFKNFIIFKPTGDLPAGMTYEEVFNIEITMQVTTNLPSIICRQFANLQTFYVRGGALRSVDQLTFASCDQLTMIFVTFTDISAIPDGTFGSNLQRLEFVDISGNRLTSLSSRSFSPEALRLLRWFFAEFNQIDEIDPMWFSQAGSLSMLALNENVCVSQNFHSVESNRVQVEMVLARCFENYGGEMTTTEVATTTTAVPPPDGHVS
jgi:Leucine-rich repeat (LRR) protein